MKIFYHNDQDGRSSASLIYIQSLYKESNNIKKSDFIELDYKIPIPIHLIENNELVYIVDYSFKESTKFELDNIFEKTKNVIWLDHHISSIRLLEKYPYFYDYKEATIILDISRSGAMITFNHLFPDHEHIPTYIKLIDDYDRFVHKYEESLLFKLYMDSIYNGPLAHVWIHLFNNNLEYDNIFKNGLVIKKFLDNANAEDADSISYDISLHGFRAIVINKFMLGRNSYMLGNKFKDYDLGIVWSFDGSKYNYSLYSINPNVDCSILAEQYGGGGHKAAAGFVSSELLFKSI